MPNAVKKNTPIDRLEQYQRLSDDAANSGDSVYRAAAQKWGAEAQIDQAIEECAELIVALRHARRGRCGAAEVAEEIADVEIMMGQLRVVFGSAAVDTAKQSKLDRLASLVRS